MSKNNKNSKNKNAKKQNIKKKNVKSQTYSYNMYTIFKFLGSAAVNRTIYLMILAYVFLLFILSMIILSTTCYYIPITTPVLDSLGVTLPDKMRPINEDGCYIITREEYNSMNNFYSKHFGLGVILILLMILSNYLGGRKVTTRFLEWRLKKAKKQRQNKKEAKTCD